jgi:hypothetical protein
VDTNSIENSLSDRERADLAAYADGSLPPARRAALEERLDAEPRLRALVDEQRRAVAAVRAIDVPAPAALRARLEAQRRDRRERPRRGRLALAGGLATSVAALALVLALTLSGEGAGPSVAQAAALSERAPAQPAPPDRGRGLLAASVEGVAFPDWDSLGWSATGARTDELDGRRVTTVFYRGRGGGIVGYQIIPGGRLDPPGKAETSVIRGVAYRFFAAEGRTIVTWTRQGHTCVLSGEGVRQRVLQRLASWRPRAAA